MMRLTFMVTVEDTKENFEEVLRKSNPDCAPADLLREGSVLQLDDLGLSRFSTENFEFSSDLDDVEEVKS